MRTSKVPQYDKIEYKSREGDGDLNPKVIVNEEKEEGKEKEEVENATE